MTLVLAVTHQTDVRVAGGGYLLLLIAGVWLVAAGIPAFTFAWTKTIVAGVLLALSGLLLITATRRDGLR